MTGRWKRAGVEDMTLLPARLSSFLPQSLVDISKIQIEERGEEGRRAGRDLSSLNPLNPPLPTESSPRCVSGLQNLYRHKRIWVLGFFFPLSFCSCQTRRKWMRAARPISQPTPHPPPLPAGLFKACTLSSDSTLFPFFLNLPHEEVGRGGEGG